MIKTFISTCALVAVVCGQVISAQELTLGSKAPKLEVKKFIKGAEVKAFEKGKIYVVELWATWCPPCVATIPHLTEVQKEHKNVTIIGVAVLEEDQNAVPEFVEKMGKKMDYRVALDLVPESGDPNDGKVNKNWLQAADQPGIPTAFIINGDGVIAWIGHPTEIEAPLDQIIAGKWDLAAEVKKMADAIALKKEENARIEKASAIAGNLKKLELQFNDHGDPKELLAALDAASKELPDQVTDLQLWRFKVLSHAKDRTDDALNVAKNLLDSEQGNDVRLLDNIAWFIIDPDRETTADPKLVKLALKVALKADNLVQNKDPAVAETLAKAYFDNGDLTNAVKTQERVLELVEGTRTAIDLTNLRKRLRQYKRALDSASSKETKVETEAPKSSQK